MRQTIVLVLIAMPMVNGLCVTVSVLILELVYVNAVLAAL